MGRRVSRLTFRKRKRTHSEVEYDDDEVDDNDEQVVNPPDEARWRNMNPYGLFAIDGEDGTKHRFKRGEIATILPHGKSPGDPIEPHEYWVGKILEIRADAGSENSDVIWTKVQWFYSPQDAVGVLKSLASTPFGKFERLWSDHWDFVLPQTFNEVIPLPRLYTFPRLPKSKTRRRNFGLSSQTLDCVSASAISPVTTITITPTTTTSTGRTVGEDQAIALGLEAQIPIGPETFYWRYTLEVQDRKINPKPTSKICLCSKPYDPDSTSLLEGVMLFCPRPTCRTGFHVGCLRDAGSVWKGGGDDASEVVVQSRGRGRGKKSKSKGRAKGKSKSKSKAKALDTANDLDDTGPVEEEFEYITPRALRLLSTSPDTNKTIDLLDLVQSASASSSSSSSLNVLSLLQRIHYRQRNQLESRKVGEPSTTHRCFSRTGASVVSGGRGGEGASAKSKISAGSIVEVEDLLIKDEDDEDAGATVSESVNRGAKTRSRTRQTQANGFTKPKSKLEKPKSKLESPKTRIGRPLSSPLTPNTLLATLFLLPSPFTPNPNPNSPIPPTTSQQNPNGSVSPTPAPPSTSNHILPQLNGTNNNYNTNTKLLLELASQPLLRGAAYFPSLGLTGNVNAVLAARRLLWEVLRALGELELSASPSNAHKGDSDDSGSDSGDDEGEEDEKDGEGEEKEEEHDDNDEEKYCKIVRCVEGILDGWKERFQADVKIIPPGGQVVEDAIVVGGLIPGSGDDDEGEEGDQALSGQQRRRVSQRSLVKVEVKPDEEDAVEDVGPKEEDLLLRVDWVCPGCGGSI